jgi:hypothetical protein
MKRSNSIDPAKMILQELDPTGLHNLLNDLWRHPQEFNEDIHMLIFTGLDIAVEGIARLEDQQIADLNQRAGGNIGSQRYVDELSDIYSVADNRRDFTYNLFFTGLMDTLARRFTKIAWQISDMIAYLPSGHDKEDPHSLIRGLLEWPKLDMQKINGLDSSGGRLKAARSVRNLLVHPHRPVLPKKRSSGQETVGTHMAEILRDNADIPANEKLLQEIALIRTHMPEVFREENGYIQANPERIHQVAEDAERLLRTLVDKHEHGWLMLLCDSLSRTE